MEAMEINENIIAEGVEMYEYKMSLPQYEAYKDNEAAMECLLKDCIHEAAFCNYVNTLTKERLSKCKT